MHFLQNLAVYLVGSEEKGGSGERKENYKHNKEFLIGTYAINYVMSTAEVI